MTTNNMAESNDDCGVKVRFIDDVAIITLCRGENRINFKFFDEVNAALDKVVENSKVKALITTGQSRFYSNGLDVELIQGLKHEDVKTLLRRYSQMLLRILTFPLPTVAAVNGHAFAGGALLSLAHDHVIMQTQKGWWCMNEVHIQLTFPTDLIAFLKSKLPPGRPLHEAVVLGRRFTAEEALRVGIVHEICPPDDLLPRALSWIRTNVIPAGYNRRLLQNMKENIYKDVVNQLNGIAPKL